MDYFKPLSNNFVSDNESVQEQPAGSEKLSSLHAKLHQEADRIRKWKVQTEIEIKQKVNESGKRIKREKVHNNYINIAKFGMLNTCFKV